MSLLIGRETDDPWDPERLVWPLLATIDASLGEPWCATLAAHLGHGRTGHDAELRRNRRYSVAIRLASLFASYAAQRPRSSPTGARAATPTAPAGPRRRPGVAARAVAAAATRVDAPTRRTSGTPRRSRPCATAGAGLDLPPRLSLFGHTRLPATEVELLGALGECRDVHLYLPQASPALWDALGGRAARADSSRARTTSRPELVGHPLLASLGRDARELRRSLDGAGFPDGDAVAATRRRPAVPAGSAPADLRANHAPTIEERAGRHHDPADRSLQVHACHGPSRQVDVLREVLVGLLQDDPTLEPRDILVMCPDIETYAPLISAGFGLAPTGPEAADGVGVTGHPAHRLRVKLADRALVSTNPLLAVAGVLLELSGGRVTASEVLDLAATEPCRRRFGFTDDELERVGRWVASTGVRWGLDQEARASFAMDRFPQNTWRTGLDRILLGVAMSGDDHRHLGTGLPLDDVGSNEIDLAGRVAELLDRLDRTPGRARLGPVR